MTDIIVTLPKSRGGLVHLGEKSHAYKYNETPYWEMSRKPKSLKKDDKVFICTEGYVRGYFIVKGIGWEGDCGITEEEAMEMGAYYVVDFVPKSYTKIKKIRMRKDFKDSDIENLFLRRSRND